MGGKGAELSRLPRDGILDRDGFGSGGTASEGMKVSAGGAVRVGDIGNGGTSSTEEDKGGRCELKEVRERENDALSETREDFLLMDFLDFFSLSSESLSLAKSYSAESPV